MALSDSTVVLSPARYRRRYEMPLGAREQPPLAEESEEVIGQL